MSGVRAGLVGAVIGKLQLPGNVLVVSVQGGQVLLDFDLDLT